MGNDIDFMELYEIIENGIIHQKVRDGDYGRCYS
jgi:hypothetical protein